ncbi:hypothetical protein PV325_006397 [Microctonus aethiopoides]|nr:hypothetical protein PV325_006397 [Microctonus aethiopoides]
MAIPFALPSEDEAEAQSQQLEQLMLDLYAALQQVLRSRSAQHPSRNHTASVIDSDINIIIHIKVATNLIQKFCLIF